MGNWHRAQIIGTCPADQVEALRAALDPGRNYENFHALVCGGLAGLPNWANETFSVVGNLAERELDAESVQEALEDLFGVAPGIECKVHIGGDYESSECVATVTATNGDALVGDPEIETIPDVPDHQMRSSLLSQLARGF